MKEILKNQLPREPSLSSPLSCRELYFFYEKNTGVSRFHVAAGTNGQFPLEEAAALLAMHCMVLGQTPQDYVVMVRAAKESLEGLAGKVEKPAASWVFREQLGQVDATSRGSTERRHTQLGEQRDCRFATCVREHREVPSIGVAEKVSRAWPERVGT